MRCGGRADVGIGPYGAIRGVVRDRVGRPQGSPLRKRYKGCSARQAGDRKGRPYGGLHEVRWAGRCRHRPLRRVASSAVGRADRVVRPYGGFTKGAVGRGMPYTHTYAYIRIYTIYTRKSLAEFAARRRQKNSNHFSPRHVRGEKYLSGCQCGILSLATKLCAQQTANPFGRKFRRNFLPVKKETPEGVSFYCIRCESYLLYRALSAAAISAKIPACFLPTTTRITSRVAIISTTAIIMQITTFCSRPAMMKLTKETAATVTP